MKSENLFGRTYGEISTIVRENMLDRGEPYTETVFKCKPTFQNPYCFNYTKEERETDNAILKKELKATKKATKKDQKHAYADTVSCEKVTVNVEEIYASY
jgi:hypothetical protein